MISRLAAPFRRSTSLATVTRSLDAAGSGRRWADDRQVHGPGVVYQAAPTIAARAQHFALNTSTGARITEALVGMLIGAGIVPRSKHPAPAIRDSLQSSFSSWTDAVDADGRSDFYGLPAWSDADVALFEQCHPLGTMARLALVLFKELAQRISDVHRLGPPMVDGDTITFTQWKNRRRNPVTLTLPLSEAVKRALAATKHGPETFLVNDYGNSFASTAAFGNKFRDWCRAAGLVDRSAHGLRKYFSANLAEHGASDREIMAFTGHRTAKEVDRYTRSANQKRLADAAGRKLSAGETVPPTAINSDGETKSAPNTLTENEYSENVVPRPDSKTYHNFLKIKEVMAPPFFLYPQ